MKKFLKFLFCAFSLVAAILGVYYVVKNVINKKDADDDFDDLDDDFDEFETEHETTSSDSREYVPINLSGSDDETTADASADDETENSDEENASEE